MDGWINSSTSCKTSLVLDGADDVMDACWRNERMTHGTRAMAWTLRNFGSVLLPQNKNTFFHKPFCYKHNLVYSCLFMV